MNGDLALLVLRVAVGVVMFAHGAMKLGWVGKGGSPAGTAGWFTSIGIRPGLFWAWVVILAEAGGGVLTILGLGGPIGPGIVAGDPSSRSSLPTSRRASGTRRAAGSSSPPSPRAPSRSPCSGTAAGRSMARSDSPIPTSSCLAGSRSSPPEPCCRS